MQRIAPLRLPRLDPLDLMVLVALAVVPISYYLGFDLRWSDDPSSHETTAAVAQESEPPEANVGPGTLMVDQRGWDELVQQLEVQAITYPGRVAIYLKDLKRNRTWSYRGDDLFPSASLIKVPIMAAVFDKIHNGELSLDTKLVMHRRDRVGGSGSIKWYPDGTSFTIRTLLQHMIDESDNTAAHMLIATAGFGYLQQQFPKMGLLYTEIFPEGMSLRSSPVRYENYTTAREMSMLLEKIYRGEMVDPYSSELMLELLKHHHVKGRLAKHVPLGWEIAHKTGLLRGACHDSAIIFTPHGDYILTVLTGQNRNYSLAKDFIDHLGRITYKYYRSEQFVASMGEQQPTTLARGTGGLLD